MLRTISNRLSQSLTRNHRFQRFQQQRVNHRGCSTNKTEPPTANTAHASTTPPPPAASSTTQQATVASGAPPTAAATTTATTGNKFEFQKYIRPFFLLLGLGYVGYNLTLNTDNPESWVNRTLSGKGKTKFVLKVERLDDQIAQYKTAYVRTTLGMREALRRRARESRSRDLGLQLDLLTEQQQHDLGHMIQHYLNLLKVTNAYTDVAQSIQNDLIKEAVKIENTAAQINASQENNNNNEDSPKLVIPEVTVDPAVMNALEARLKLELSLVRSLHLLLSKEAKTKKLVESDPGLVTSVKNKILGLHEDDYGLILQSLKKTAFIPAKKQPRGTFKGDVMATAVNTFREEVTAFLTLANPGRDEVLIRLNSGGGTVTGYGLAAAQIARLRERGYKVTVVVDEVAASGGYLMAAVADKIYCSPFTVIGSIGVIVTVPNVTERLTREGITVEDVTAGKFKRTLTPYKKPTNEDRTKVKEDAEGILTLFKAYLKQYRPQLDVDKLATGETWHGPQALALGLVDGIKTYDDLLLDYVEERKEVYHLTVKPYMPRFPGLDDDQQASASSSSFVSLCAMWLQNVVMNAVQNAIFSTMQVPTTANTSSYYTTNAYEDRVRMQDEAYTYVTDDDTMSGRHPHPFLGTPRF
eukprot:scaffold5486_cov282-Ochromonas_danica.AAC.2